jgi:hypothetical protein
VSVIGPSRRDQSSRRDAVLDLATLLARAYLRLAETSRRDAVSGAREPHDSLDISALRRPDVTDVRADRRVS